MNRSTNKVFSLLTLYISTILFIVSCNNLQISPSVPNELDLTIISDQLDCSTLNKDNICIGSNLSWLPDGKWLLVISHPIEPVSPHDAPKWPNIFAINIQEKNLIQLTDFTQISSRGGIFGLSWSPIGNKILFSAPNFKIYYFEFEKSILKPLTLDEIHKISIPEGEFEAAEPTWSPDGTKLTFVNLGVYAGSEESRIMTMNSNSTNLEEILYKENTLFHSSYWNPKKDQIALVGETFDVAFNNNIYLVQSDGSNLIQISSGEKDLEPKWSPDGNWIVFEREHEAGSLALIRVKDKFLIELPISGWGVSWSPDGKKLAINSNSHNNNPGIYLVDMSWLEMEWAD